MKWRTSSLAAGTLAVLGITAGCVQDMADQPKYEPYESSAFFPDGRTSRLPVPGTVAQGQLREDTHFYTGRIQNADGKLVLADAFPLELTHAVLDRGGERFNIFCSPCHDALGTGDGMVVRRGFRKPPSFHSERLRAAPVGHFFDVMTNGFGAMYDYSAQIPPADRWAIAAYLRVLQASQNAALADVPPSERQKLEGGGS